MTRPFLLGAGIAIGWLGAGVVTTWPTTAHAYRTFESDRSVGAHARHASDAFTWDLASEGSDPWRSVVEAQARTAFATWTAPSCTALRATFAGTTTAPAAPGDGRNTIEIVRTGWAARGFPAGRAATTDVQLLRTDDYGVRQAEIAEADVYLNFEEHAFSTAERPAPGELDLLGVLVHEIGHQAIGLRHPCERETAGEPLCEVLPEARLSAMYPEYLGVSQRTLSSDDVAGVCDLYPIEGCPLSCGIGARCVEMVSCETCPEGDCTPVCLGPSCDPLPDVACDPMRACERGVCASFYTDMGECASAGALGTPCLMGEECESGLCLVRGSGSPEGYCTSRCADSSACGLGQVCGQDSVCRPPPAQSCSVAPGSPASPWWMSVLGVAIVSLARRRGFPSRSKS